RGVGQVLGRGRRTHGKRPLAVGIELGERGADLLFAFRRERRVDDPLAEIGASSGQLADIFGMEAAETLSQTTVPSRSLEKVAEGLGGRGKAARHANPRAGQLADHFT